MSKKTVSGMLASAPTMTVTPEHVEAMRKQAFRALRAYDAARDASAKAADDARAKAQREEKAKDAYLAARMTLDYACAQLGITDALPADACERYEREDEERRAKARAQRRAREAKQGERPEQTSPYQAGVAQG